MDGRIDKTERQPDYIRPLAIPSEGMYRPTRLARGCLSVFFQCWASVADDGPTLKHVPCRSEKYYKKDGLTTTKSVETQGVPLM